LTFANPDLIKDMQELAVKRVVDGVSVKWISHQILLAIQQVQRQRFEDNQVALKRAISIYA
jgi:hypothetical protein